MCSEDIYEGPRIKNTETFIRKAKWVHRDKDIPYSYEKVNYVDSKSHVTITCQLHGDFTQSPRVHLSGRGCLKCRNDSFRTSKDDFIDQANGVHGFFYDYSEVVYHNTNTHVKILCPFHGSFTKTPQKHLKGQGCPRCSRDSTNKIIRRKTDEFIDLAENVHGAGTYDYTFTSYINAHEKVTIVCPIHGEFNQTPNSHISGSGCPSCGSIRSSDHRRYDANTVEGMLRKIHNGSYEYDFSNYENLKTIIPVTCKSHGVFMLSPRDMIHGEKICPECKIEEDKSIFIERARKIHGDKYDYDLHGYNGSLSKITVICPSHGAFRQSAHHHLEGRGCSKCGYEMRPSPIAGMKESSEQDATFYHIKIMRRDGTSFEKIGITTKTVEERFSHIRSIGLTFEIIKTIRSDLLTCYNMEQEILEREKQHRFKIKDLKNTSIGGWTECFPCGVVIISE